ncbi:hypothetical protein N6H18_13580 [Reichenbachiella agarivorans]|uniref:Outer membrane protein beta-barrel domain-containing protein n=1 Tax=Reichenbachiella agarivorans TaxID=2979464 RepID=A0ABY6CLJ3_9BACT|nr:hypothetical protein [Reichenbachiella agarivorans]UXP31381.1 hypothetical protein N6H18_13580 [Reichenbachiella agarivorans]
MNDQHQSTKNINLIDRVCQNASKTADHLFLSTSKKASIWENLSKKLSEVDKRILTWFFAMATSISLLIAGSLDLLHFDKISKPAIEKQMGSAPLNRIKTEIALTSKESSICRMNSKGIAETLRPLTVASIPTIVYDHKETIPAVAAKEAEKKTSFPIVEKFKPNFFGSLAISNIGASPEIGISAPILKIESTTHVQQLSLGVSGQMTFYQEHSPESKVVNQAIPSYYVNLEYDIKGKNSKSSGWGARVGYRINSGDSSLFDKQTIKASVHKNINNHIKVGPEIIFTNNFKKVYPGIALVVS